MKTSTPSEQINKNFGQWKAKNRNEFRIFCFFDRVFMKVVDIKDDKIYLLN